MVGNSWFNKETHNIDEKAGNIDRREKRIQSYIANNTVNATIWHVMKWNAIGKGHGLNRKRGGVLIIAHLTSTNLSI